jgi:hypothetical protein
MQHSPRSLAAAVALLCASGAAFSTNIGISPTAGPVLNPLNGQETQVWKLVGKSSGCTAFQITREWIMATNHCGPSNSVGGNPVGDQGFSNSFGHSAVNEGSCATVPGRDIRICRLTTPSALTAASSYPPLVAAKSVFTRLNANKLGVLLAYGRSTPDLLTFVGFDGIPAGFDPAVNTTGSTIPYAIHGDSGGAVYWFSSTSSSPALSGVIGGGNTLVPSGTAFLTDADISWVVSTITQNGDPAPGVVSVAQHYTGPAGNTASELSSPPTFLGTGYNWTASWATPSPEPVTAYIVSLGKNGTLDRAFAVSAGTGNTASFNGLSPEKYRACVRPLNAVGLAPAVRSVTFTSNSPIWGVVGIDTPNCASFDLRLPTTVGALSFSSTYTAATGLYKVTATWAAPSTPDLTPKYRVAQTLTYPSGPVRTSTATTTSTSYSATNLQAGSQVCLTVTGYSRADVLGTPSSTQCFTAN